MTVTTQLRVLEVVQSLEKGGRTTRFTDTVSGLRDKSVFVLPLCLSAPVDWVGIDQLTIIERKKGINWQLIFNLRNLIKANKINLVHAHCESSQLYAGLAAFTCNVKVIGTFHRSDLSRYQPNLVNKLLRFFVNQYVAVSHDRLSLLTEHLNFPKAYCHVVHGGTIVESAPTKDQIDQARKMLSIPEKQITLLSLGHLGHIKGHQDTITALATLIDNNPEVHLYIAGAGSTVEKQKIEQQITHLNLKNKVTLLEQISNAKAWLQACDIFVQPSIEEAFGLVFIEAGAQAKPVVATNVGGIKEIIIDKETGYLVTPESPNEIAKALQALIDSPEQRTLMGANAYRRVKKHFSIEAMIDSYLTIFNNKSF